MKLASLKEGRDGRLIVVSRDLKKAIAAGSIATLQDALDNWKSSEKFLSQLSDRLNRGEVKDAFDVNVEALHSPLPRAYQWIDGSAYVNHVELVRKARGAEMPPSFWTDPLMYQGCSDAFLSPTETIRMGSEDWGIDFEAEVVVVTDDVPMGIDAKSALNYVRLIGLVNDVSLRNLIPHELAKGFGFFQSKPASSFSPVFVTPDEIADSWRDGKLHLPLRSEINGKLFGEPNAGVDMTFDFGVLISHAAKTRHLCAGTILGSGTVSNLDRSLGSSCIAERRMLETIDQGKATTSFMNFGDRIRIEMLDKKGVSIFGAIDQKVMKYEGPQK